MKPFVFLLSAAALSGCCTKKMCTGKALPELVIQFNGLSQNSDGQVMLYTLEQGQVKDSLSLQLSSNRTIKTYPFAEYENVPGKSYMIKWNNKQQSISELNCDFHTEKMECNKCYPFGKDDETISTYSTFSYRSGNQAFIDQDTLRLNW